MKLVSNIFRSALGRLYYILVCLFTLDMSISAHAQLPDTGESVEQRQYSRSQDQLRRFQQEIERAPNGLDLQEIQPKENVDRSGNCVQVNMIEMLGQTKYSPDKFDSLTLASHGQCLYISDINNLLRAITNRYIQDGYVTSRAILSEQDLNDGTLQIRIVEGRVEEVKAVDEAFSSRELTFAFPIKPNKRLNLRDIEQGIDQLSRLPSKNPTTDIEAGDSVGGSIILVENTARGRPYRGSVSIDNSGQSSTGKTILSSSLSAENILNVNDLWSFSANTDLDGGEGAGAWGVNGFLSIPYGYFSTSLSGGYFAYKSIVPGFVGDIDNDGTSWFANTSLDWLIYRDKTRKLSLSTGLGITDNDNFVSDIRLLASSFRLVTVSLGLDYQERMWGGLLSTSGNWVRGTNLLGAETIFTGDTGPQKIFNKFEFDINFSRAFNIKNEHLFYSARARGQFSDENLFSAERISIGSPSAVRGFRSGGISGDEGLYLRQELNWSGLCCDIDTGWLEDDLDISVFGAFDVGRIRTDISDDFERGVLKSVSVGGRMRVHNALFSLSVSHGFDSPFFVTQEGVEINASATISF